MPFKQRLSSQNQLLSDTKSSVRPINQTAVERNNRMRLTTFTKESLLRKKTSPPSPLTQWGRSQLLTLAAAVPGRPLRGECRCGCIPDQTSSPKQDSPLGIQIQENCQLWPGGGRSGSTESDAFPPGVLTEQPGLWRSMCAATAYTSVREKPTADGGLAQNPGHTLGFTAS